MRRAYVALNGERWDVPTATVGAISELMVSTSLLKRRYEVFRALSAACTCDLIASRDGVNYRIEVKTGCRTPTGDVPGPSSIRKLGAPNRFDYLAYVLREPEEIRYFDAEGQPVPGPPE